MIIIFFSGCVLISALPSDPTWYRITDFSKIAALYRPIKESDNIRTIAAYPISLNFGNTGFPQTYQLLGQIIHEKPYANGSDLFSRVTPVYQGKIKDISNEQTIRHLAEYGVDTIIVYNRMLKRPDVIEKLKNDPRLTYSGRFTQSYDGYYVSASDLSRDISVFQINPELVRKPENSVFSIDGESLEYKKVGSHMYIIKIDNSHIGKKLVFASPYSSKWQLLDGDLGGKNDLYFINRTYTEVEKSEMHAEYYNSWLIQPPDTGNKITKTLIFRPYFHQHLGDIISRITIVTCILFILFLSVRNYFLQKN